MGVGPGGWKRILNCGPGAGARRLRHSQQPRKDGKESLGVLSIKVDQSHFAEQYYSSILRLNKLTAHQRKQLDKVRSTEKSVHVKAPAGAQADRRISSKTPARKWNASGAQSRRQSAVGATVVVSVCVGGCASVIVMSSAGRQGWMWFRCPQKVIFWVIGFVGTGGF